MPALPAAVTTPIDVPISTSAGVMRMTSDDIFISYASIFLPRYSGRAAHHQAGHEDGDDGEHEHAVEARAHAAVHDLAELDHPHRHQAADAA